MTNPVILLGTQSNGETLPVQVDATGRLVAEGLQGEQGEQGEQGIQGPPGPPGPGGIVLPPDPYEGALLGWLNGELAWLSAPPIEIAEGVFGPITNWDPDNQLLEIAGEIPSDVGTGVYLYQCEPNGAYFTDGWDVSDVWSSFGDSNTDPNQGWNNFFDGTWGQGATLTQPTRVTGGETTWTYPGDGLAVATEVEFSFATSGGGKYFVNGVQYSASQTKITSAALNGRLKSLTLTNYSGSDYCVGYGAKVDGRNLVDRQRSLNFRVQSVFGTSMIGIEEPQGMNFTVGKYLRKPLQRIAPWVLYGNDPTSLIDHLRRTRD